MSFRIVLASLLLLVTHASAQVIVSGATSLTNIQTAAFNWGIEEDLVTVVPDPTDPSGFHLLIDCAALTTRLAELEQEYQSVLDIRRSLMEARSRAPNDDVYNYYDNLVHQATLDMFAVESKLFKAERIAAFCP